MSYNVSACVFIKNNFIGAFALFESMATLLPFVDEFIIMDLGSSDDTLPALEKIADSNPKVKLVHGSFYKTDANVFATLANDLIDMCYYENVIYYQADEIWHPLLLKQMVDKFEEGEFDLSFWRIQFERNFQRIKWFPHLVHRVGKKDNFNFVGDGMNSDRAWDAKLCSGYNGGWFARWGAEFDKKGRAIPHTKRDDTPDDLPVHEMITDISLVGAFLENIGDRRRMHSPFWHEEPWIRDVDNNDIMLPIPEWYEKERQVTDWFFGDTHFDIPPILEGLVGQTKYILRPELLDAICNDDTLGIIKYG